MQILTIVIGISIFFGSFFYGKKEHKKLGEGVSQGSNSDSLLALAVMLIIGFFLSIGPWWVTKIIFITIGIGVVYLGVFLM